MISHQYRTHFIYRISPPGSRREGKSFGKDSDLSGYGALYVESFAILGLAEYSLTFSNKEAAACALNLFRSVDAEFNDPRYLDYDEQKTTEIGRKETGNIMHLIEAFTTLYKATGDPQVGQRLNEFIDVWS